MYTNTLFFFSEFHIIPTWNIHTNEHSAPKSFTFWNLEILSLWYISIYSYIEDYGMDFVIKSCRNSQTPCARCRTTRPLAFCIKLVYI